MRTSIERLKQDPKGKIFLAQVARAVEDLPIALPADRAETLREFLEDCLRKVESGPLPEHEFGGIDSRAAFFDPIIVPRQGQYFHLDRTKLAQDARLVSLVPLRVLTNDLLPPGKLQGNGSDAELALSVARLTGPDFRSSARVGAGALRPTNICWASRLDDVLRVAPSLRKRDAMLPREEAERLRNYLGLGHYGDGTQYVVLMFRAGALEAHGAAREQKVTRPFIFEGVGNHRFFIFDRTDEVGWNHALDLASLEDERAPPAGGREIVMTSISCQEITRCMLSEAVGVSPCEKQGADDRILKLMLSDRPLEAAVKQIEAFLDSIGGPREQPS